VGRFCAKCGAEREEYVRSLCKECFWKGALSTVPKEVKLTYCKDCRSRMQGKRWVKPRFNALEDEIAEAASEAISKLAALPEGIVISGHSVEVTGRDGEGLPRSIALRVRFTEAWTGSSAEAVVEVSISYSSCSMCGGAERGKYDAIVQVRGEGRALDDRDFKAVGGALESLESKSGRQEVTEVKEKEGGIDVKFVTLFAARAFAKILSEGHGAETVESAKLIGVDKVTGGRAYRTTISARMPALREGTIFEFGGRAYRTIGFRRGRALAEDAEDAEMRRAFTKRELEAGAKVISEIRSVRLDALTQSCGIFYESDGKRFLEIPVDMIPKDMVKGEEGLLMVVDGKERVFRTR